MRRKIVMLVGVLGFVAVPGSGATAMELKTDPKTAVSADLGYSVTRQCKVIVTQSCNAGRSRLGELTTLAVPVPRMTVSSSTKSHCVEPKTGAIKGADPGYETRKIVFTPNGAYGFEQVTVRCEKSDGTKAKHTVKITVARP